MLCLGLDPGRTGGGVLALDGLAIAAVCWRPYVRQGQRLFSLACATQGSAIHQTRGLTGAHQIGTAMHAWLAPKVVIHGAMMLVGCETAYIGRNPRTGIVLSRWGGALVGPVEHWDPTRQAQWVEAASWRRLSFRPKWWATQAAEAGKVPSQKKANRLVLERWDGTLHPGASRAEVDAIQKQQAKALFMPKRQAAKQEAALCMPELMPGLADLAAKVSGAEHVYDAAGVCRWRWLQGAE